MPLNLSRLADLNRVLTVACSFGVLSLNIELVFIRFSLAYLFVFLSISTTYKAVFNIHLHRP